MDSQENKNFESYNSTNQRDCYLVFIDLFFIYGIILFTPFFIIEKNLLKNQYSIESIGLIICITLFLSSVSALSYSKKIEVSQIFLKPTEFIIKYIEKFSLKYIQVKNPENEEEDGFKLFIIWMFLPVVMFILLYVLEFIISILGLIIALWYYIIAILLLIGAIRTLFKSKFNFFSFLLFILIIIIIVLLYEYRNSPLIELLYDYFLKPVHDHKIYYEDYTSI